MDVEQWAHFAEFVRLERAVGGPDPHMATAGKLVEDASDWSRIWMGGLYVGVYNVPGAELLRERLSVEMAMDAGHVESLLRDVWPWLPFRRERRAVRTPEKLARYLASYAKWMMSWPRPWHGISDPVAAYADAERDVADNLYGVGRYATLKLLEFLRRYCGAQIELVGIRAEGGWSPREGLALLFPDVADRIRTSPHFAEDLAAMVRLRLETEDGIELDWYNTQVLLCDYKQVWTGRRQYPGRSLDSEIAYGLRAGEMADLSRFWAARRALFPVRALGELQGWSGPREELGHFLRQMGQNWNPL